MLEADGGGRNNRCTSLATTCPTPPPGVSSKHEALPRAARQRGAAAAPQLKHAPLDTTRVSLTPLLESIEALYRKLERESYRTYHSAHRLQKADFFFNFCITAHSMRDYFLRRQGITARKDSDRYHELWNKNHFLVAVRDIANTSKHFTLGRPPKTRGVRLGRSSFADIYVSSSGSLSVARRTAPDITVTLSDDRRYPLHEFLREVLGFWRTYLAQHGITIRRQPLSRLIASARGA